jgi:alginate O-acetyltransferase complex protein AlgI
MLFPSVIFIFVFAPIAIGGYWFIGNDRVRRLWLTAASYVFYGYWDWRFCSLLLVSTAVDYLAGLRIAASDVPAVRRAWLIVSLCANLGLLGFFKYYMLLAATANHVAGWFGAVSVLPGWEIILPIGISFFTFQSMSYTLDIYRRQIDPTHDFIEFAAYVSLFPQLVAGPIVRYRWICDRLRNLPKHLNLGLFFFTVGLIKKVLIADRIAYYIDPMFTDYLQLQPVEAWLSMIGYSLQLYFDFAGYSLMAIGLGHLLGFQFPQNFNSPYQAVSISDFWRRWHMTLSSWLRDYLYIPLGGRNNRLVALGLTMLLGGLWHGAYWTFLVWGAYHAVLLQLHHLLKRVPWIPRNVVWARIGTFILVTVGWVFFRPPNFTVSMTLLGKMFDVPGLFTHATPQPGLIGIVALALAWAMLAPNAVELITVRKAEPRLSWAIVLGFLGAVCVLLLSETGPFLYFQF